MNDVAGQRLAQLVDVHVVTRPFHVIGDIVRRRITTQFIRADILNHFSHDSEPSRSGQARIVTVASVCSASARVAVTSGIVLLAWLVGTGILVLRGFYFPQVPRRGISLPPAVNRAPCAGGHGGRSATRPDAV